MIRIKQSKNYDLIKKINKDIMPQDELVCDEHTTAWICYVDGEIAGFCTLRSLSHGIVYFDRGGVYPKYQGKGIHSRLVSVRERFSKASGASKMITYTLKDNYASMFTLVRAGFKLYKPEYPWVGTEVCYFIKLVPK